ncbi:MAG: tRNA1(Val) (adenine(37)-N6)-methyltransferase [Clostridia bacterium]|nr:tRNA1(Val) (adenine(37)-N6)-methyltransferase [Clostridia bacterium]
MKLKKDERVDDLQFKDLKIIQNKNAFCFGIDAVLLSDFAKNVKNNSTVVDLCSGTGIVAILLEGKTKIKKIYAVEIQQEMAEMASRSVLLNHQEEKIEVINEDLKRIDTILKKDSVDAITVNPPYKKAGSGIINETDTKSISRHEVLCTLEDIIKVSARLLKTSGSIYMVHRTERLVDVLSEMRSEKIEPKRIRFIHPSYGKAPNLFLVEGIKHAKPFLKIEEPIYVYEKDENYTDTIKEIYHIDK